MATFPFNDLHSFKDYVVFVRMCAPDKFPIREGVSIESQWSLDLAFKGLRMGLAYLPPDHAGKCERLFEEAYNFYEIDDKKGGFLKLEDVRGILAKRPSQ